MEQSNENHHVQSQLLVFFNQLFSKQGMRKNLYLFKNLNSQMEVPIKVIEEERKVALILNLQKPNEIKNNYRQKKNHQSPQYIQLVTALNKCPLVQVLVDKVKIKVQGDLEIVRLKYDSSKQKKIRKTVQNILKDIKHQIHQVNHQELQIKFQSNAAATTFVQRLQLKQQNQNQFQIEIIPKDPYQSIKQAISKMKKQRKSQAINYQNNNYDSNYQAKHYNFPNNYQHYQTYQPYIEYNYATYYQVQPFIRRAVESQDQEEDNTTNVKLTVQQNKLQFDKQQQPKQSKLNNLVQIEQIQKQQFKGLQKKKL